MHLQNRLLKLRPSLSIEDFDLQDDSDGNGPFISDWRSSETEPTQEEIASVDDSKPTAVLWEELRQQRDQLLHDTDWWVLRGSITEAQTAYRQALRELPATVADPANPTWPVAPGA